MQAVCPEGHIDGDLVIPLPGEIVEGEGLLQQCVQLRHGLFLHFLGGGQALDMGADLHIPDLEHIVQRIPGKRAFRDHGDHRHAQPLHQHAQLPGQGVARPSKE